MVPSNVVDLAERTHSGRGDLAERTHCGTTVRTLRVTPRLSRDTSRQPLPKPQLSGSRSVHCGIARVKTNPSFFRLITVLGSGRWPCAHANGRIRTDFAGGTGGSEHRFYRLGIEQRLWTRKRPVLSGIREVEVRRPARFDSRRRFPFFSPWIDLDQAGGAAQNQSNRL
jgi:hypothetical protein